MPTNETIDFLGNVCPEFSQSPRRVAAEPRFLPEIPLGTDPTFYRPSSLKFGDAK